MDFKTKKKKIIDRVYKVVSIIDPKGDNPKRLKDMLSKMDEKEFTQYMEYLRDGKTKLYLYFPNLTENPISLENAIKASHEVNVKLCERIKLYDDATGKWFKTNREYLVLRLPIRRVRQYIMGKMSVPDSDKVQNTLTGQVTGKDRAARLTFVELQSLASKGLMKTIYELAKIRGGDSDAYMEAKQELERSGHCVMSTIGEGSRVKSADTLRMYFLGMHIHSNI